MSERLVVDSLMTADGEVVQLPTLGPLGLVDAQGGRMVAVVMRRDGRLQEVDPWRVVIDDSEEVFEMYSWMWDEESVVCEQLGLAGVKAEKGGEG